MRKVRLIFAILIVTFVFGLQYLGNQRRTASLLKILQEAKYDSTLAIFYGADDYGMKQYVMAFLKKGPNRPTDSLEAMKLQEAHLKNIQRLADEGKLVLAGPFTDDGELRGIYIFNVSSVEEAKQLVATDPLIRSGGLVMELKPFYGTASLQALNDLHRFVQKKSITEQ